VPTRTWRSGRGGYEDTQLLAETTDEQLGQIPLRAPGGWDGLRVLLELCDQGAAFEFAGSVDHSAPTANVPPPLLAAEKRLISGREKRLPCRRRASSAAPALSRLGSAANANTKCAMGGLLLSTLDDFDHLIMYM
jgi:hypothetical protein